jgi:hypothetical protein
MPVLEVAGEGAAELVTRERGVTQAPPPRFAQVKAAGSSVENNNARAFN